MPYPIRTLEVPELTLATREIRMSAVGTLGSESAQARISLNATDLKELQPALDALDPGTRIPVELEGRASFNGNLYGQLDSLSARGHLELEKFDTDVHMSLNKDAQGKPVPGATVTLFSQTGAAGDATTSPAAGTGVER